MKNYVRIVLVSVFFGLGCGETSISPTAPTSVGEACNYKFLPSKIVTSSASKKLIVQVVAGPTCRWVATTPDSWIEIAYQGGNGTGDLILNIERNQCTSEARTGHVRIKGVVNGLEIFQDGSDLDICPKIILGATS